MARFRERLFDMSVSQFRLSKRVSIAVLLAAIMVSGVVGMGLHQASAAGAASVCVSAGNVQFSSAQSGATVGVRVIDANHNVLYQQSAIANAHGSATISVPA